MFTCDPRVFTTTPLVGHIWTNFWIYKTDKKCKKLYRRFKKIPCVKESFVYNIELNPFMKKGLFMWSARICPSFSNSCNFCLNRKLIKNFWGTWIAKIFCIFQNILQEPNKVIIIWHLFLKKLYDNLFFYIINLI